MSTMKENAIQLGFKEIDVIELGVAGGNGIKSILKYKRKIIAGPESVTNANEVNWAITFQLIIVMNLKNF